MRGDSPIHIVTSEGATPVNASCFPDSITLQQWEQEYHVHTGTHIWDHHRDHGQSSTSESTTETHHSIQQTNQSFHKQQEDSEPTPVTNREDSTSGQQVENQCEEAVITLTKDYQPQSEKELNRESQYEANVNKNISVSEQTGKSEPLLQEEQFFSETGPQKQISTLHDNSTVTHISDISGGDTESMNP